MLNQKIEYSTWHKMISGELKGSFELHLDVISKPEHQYLRKPPRLCPHCDFWSFLRDLSLRRMCRQQKVNNCAFFLGGPLEESWSSFLHWHRLSPLHVWFGQQLVRLIALINPVKVLNNIIHPKSLKKFLRRLFDSLSSQNDHVWDFQGLYKQICLL